MRAALMTRRTNLPKRVGHLDREYGGVVDKTLIGLITNGEEGGIVMKTFLNH